LTVAEVTDTAVKLIRSNEYAVHKLIINRPRTKLTAMAVQLLLLPIFECLLISLVILFSKSKIWIAVWILFVS
jgi:hypothetical protein